jgi:hypothetical protein
VPNTPAKISHVADKVINRPGDSNLRDNNLRDNNLRDNRDVIMPTAPQDE